MTSNKVAPQGTPNVDEPEPAAKYNRSESDTTPIGSTHSIQ
jgi:hypothetical protein